MSQAVLEKTDLETFRKEVRSWLSTNFPRSLENQGMIMFAEGRGPDGSDFLRWKKIMAEKGWGTPTWPKEYGGGGLTRPEARVLQEELNRIGAFNPIGGMGIAMFGPTLLEYGNEEIGRASRRERV